MESIISDFKSVLGRFLRPIFILPKTSRLSLGLITPIPILSYLGFIVDFME